MFRSHTMPQEILDFLKKNGPYSSNAGWYSEHGILKSNNEK